MKDETIPYIPYPLKYRPARFADVTQTHVTRVLEAQIATGKTCATYLFKGPPGTGKTTLARVMAAALLCEARDGVEPCGKCRNCIDIRNDANRDVMEVNCATHGKVEDVRDMISERMVLSPTRGNLRIFIMDECQMLTKQAQNALLKILEEPPSYVKFYLCTTEPQKIEPAIRTRCQIHALKCVSNIALIGILRNIVEVEQLIAEDAALELIIDAAEGSARTALVLLEQVSAIGVTEENVREVLCRSANGVAIALLDALYTTNRAEMLRIVESVQAEGRDIAALMEETARYFMTIVKYKLFKTPVNEQNQALTRYLKGFTSANGKAFPGLTGPQATDATALLLEILTKVRQNVPAELVAVQGMLNIIERFAKSRVVA